MKTAENWATCRQCLELALDTPQAAERFNAYCIRRGFRRIDTVRLSDNAHSSLVLSKALDRRALSLGTDHWPARHPLSCRNWHEVGRSLIADRALKAA